MEAAGTLIATHSHNVNLLSKQERLIQGMICSMSSAIEARDPYTCGHSDRVGRYARLVAEQIATASARSGSHLPLRSPA
ncbi:MAG: hypothetical protein R3C02_15025 [Planctomycetaceae bacterium]